MGSRGDRRLRFKLLAAAGLVAPAALAGALVVLDRTASYHSPLWTQAAPRATPRARGIEALAAFRVKRAEEMARRAELLAGLTTERMIELGREIVHGRGLCFNCHRIGSEGRGVQGPDLADVGARAAERIAGLGAVEYLTQSLYRPNAYVVEGFVPAMTPADEPPIGLTKDEVLWVIAYLETLGGEASVTPETELPDPDRLPSP